MKYTEEQLKSIFQKTNGVCRICRGTEGPELNFSSYGNIEAANGWEVEHLNVKHSKGSHNPDNWWPVHIKCNSQKGIKKTNKARRSHGVPPIPLVPEQDMNLERQMAELRSRAGL